MTILPDEETATADAFVPVVVAALPEDAPEWAVMLNDNLGMVASGINLTNANITRALDAIEFVKNEVSPIVDSLSKNPMFKMMGIGK